MADTLSVDEALPRTAEAAARGVGATAARVTLLLPDGSRRVTSWPDQAGETTFPHVLPVRYQGETIGEIAIRKGAGEILTPGERRLLADLAAQAGLVLHNVRLTAALQAQLEQLSIQAADLRASRQRIVTAQETERRRAEAEIRPAVQAADAVGSGRFEPGIEAAVYCSCLEALRRATTSTVIRLVDDRDQLRFSVDGLAAVVDGEMQASQDRIAAVGGTLEIGEAAV